MLRKLAILFAVAVVVFLTAVGVALVALPPVLGAVAQREIANLTGRPTTIGNVDLNLFTQHLVVRDVRIADRDGGAPLAELGRLDARFRLLPLLHGTIEIDALSLDTPVVRVRRDERGVLNVADILERYLTRPGGEARRFLLTAFTLDRGHLVFEDHAVKPARVWETRTFTIAVQDVGSDLTHGRATVRFDLGGSKALVEAEEIAVHPVAARFRVALEGFDLDFFRPYLPRDSAVTIAGGRVTARAQGQYSVANGLRASGQTELHDVALVRRGDPAPFLIAPTLWIVAHDVTSVRGVSTARRLEMWGDPHVFDRRSAPPRRIAVSPFRLVLESARHPSSTPAQLHVTAGADGAVLDARGPVVFEPFTANVAVTLTGANLALARPYLPPNAPVTADGGTLAATLAVRADREVVTAGGEFTVTDLVVGRAGQSEPLVRDPLVKGTVTNLTLRGGALAVDAVTLTATPTVIDASRGTAQRFEITQLAGRVQNATWPGRAPATVEVDAALGSGGTARLEGTVHPATLAMRARTELKDVDVTPFTPYLPPDAAVTLGGGRLSGRLRVAHERATGLRLNGRAAVADLVLRRRGQAGDFATDPRLSLVVRDLVVRDGVTTVRDATLTGAPTIIEATGPTPQRFEVGRLTASVRELSWPAQGPARIAIDLALARGGTSALTGSLHPGTLAADATATFVGIDLTRFTPYFPADAPFALGGGAVTGRASMTHHSAAGVTVNGTATINDLVLLRRGQPNAFVTDPSLDLAVSDLVIKGRALTARQATVAGTPVVFDVSGRTPQRFELSALSLRADDISWPGTTPLRVHASGTLKEGGSSEMQATLDLVTLAAKGRATLTDVPLRYANAYLAPDLAVLPAGGRVQAAFDISHDRATGVLVAGEGAITDLALVRRGQTAPFLTDPRFRFAVTDLRILNETYAATRVTASGTPVFIDQAVTPPRRLAIPGYTLTVDQARWPSDRPGTLTFEARLPDAGQLVARGTLDVGTRTVLAELDLRDAAVAPFTPFLPISTEARGRFNASLAFRGVFTGELDMTLRGSLGARDVAIGPGPDVSIGVFDVQGIEFRWPERLRIDAITIRQPYALLERARDGSFPLRAKLSPRPLIAADGAAAPTARAAATDTHGAGPRVVDRVRFTVGAISIEDGDVRFLDRTTQPTYSEEITQLNVKLRDLTNIDDRRADLTLQGVVGGHAALTLEGVVAPFASPYLLDLAGELRDFPVTRTNPYLQKVVDWVAKSGRLTTRIHYRIHGDELRATNDIVVHRLDLEPGRGGDQLVGVPLGLAVSLLKDTRGDIRLSLPVEGRLSSPQFDLGDAIGSALRNTAARLVTAPFRAIGSVFQREDGEPEVKVQPLAFAAGSAVLAPDAGRHVQRVADFLRASPNVRIGLGAVVSRDDLVALRAQRTAARVQRLQRERGIDGFDAAARRLWTDTFPDAPVPATTEEIVSALAAASREPDRATQRLVSRRLAAVRQALIDAAGIPPTRVIALETPPTVGATGAGRIEFQLLP